MVRSLLPNKVMISAASECISIRGHFQSEELSFFLKMMGKYKRNSV